MNIYDIQREALAVCIAAKKPVVLWSNPGQGKSSVVVQIAESMGVPIEILLACLREPSDFAGLPFVADGKTTLLPPDWAQRLAEAGKGILFLDEISTAPPSVQAALLAVALDRKVGSLYLGDDIAIVAAANPPETSAGGWEMSAPLSNRFVHFDWSVPAHVISDGFAFGFPTTNVPDIDLDDAEKEKRAALLLVASFLKVQPNMVEALPNTTNVSGERAFPTPRSWEMAAHLYGYATAAKVSDEARRLLLVGSVGQAATGAFLEYVSELDLPDAEDVLENPNEWDVPARGDRVYAVAAAVLAALTDNNTESRWVQTGKVVAVIANAGHADVAVSIARKWLEIRPSASVTPDAESIMALTPVLKAANLMP